MARFRNHLTFLIKCRNKKLIPKGLRVTVPSTTDQGKRIADRTGHALVRERIKYVRKYKLDILSELHYNKVQLSIITSMEVYEKVLQWSNSYASKTFDQVKEKQRKKFACLLRESNCNKKPTPKPTLKNTVINLSSYQLNEDEENILSLGLNYALPHKKLPLKDIIASTEQTAKSLPPKTAQLLRDNVKACILDYKQPHQSNLTKNQHQTLSKLKEMDSIVILPADKGNATVVMDRSKYAQKMEELLNDTSYIRIDKDPTKKTERTLNDRLKDLERSGEITMGLKKRITASNSYCPQLYGLPKIHKPDIPLRPIVASIGSATYHLEK